MSEVARDQLPVVVIGAGPVGLAAVAHLMERGVECLLLEAGDRAGSAVASWGHVRLFSPWRYDIDGAAQRLLEKTGWVAPDFDALPTGTELVREYMEPLAKTAELASRLRLETRVIAVAREGGDKTRSLGRERQGYRVRTMNAEGRVEDVLARAVIDASGTFASSNPLGMSGLPAAGEVEAASFITGPLPDVLGVQRDRFAGKHTLVVGMGHSAANTLLSLVDLAESEPGTTITWAIRGGSPRRVFGGGIDDQLPARGQLGSRLQQAVESGKLTLLKRVSIEQLVPGEETVQVLGQSRDEPLALDVHAIVNATGFRPDLTMLREVRLELDPAVEAPTKLAPLIDPNFHSCGSVPPHGEAMLSHPDDGFYLVGMKSYGRAPTFLLATGYEQVRSIAAALAGDRESADKVELDLPETGVCSTDLAFDVDGEAAGGSCCAVPAGPQPVALGVGAPTGNGFATGVVHGRSGDDANS
ncbi:Predicted flavoprotein CzcO associated with the cation diffusion facilitator CzcD [Paramicrobacterium humi]|uniref:Predicted flavoprotein CzcO associated with the cation diffusion facilitator CzcD n=1 Tax=Paramicrobacterium humi TaxID=640635 RepID=A0A1H4K6G7_9MICO|nr:FAD-dependent oxidoreductase [Microbacterium humi]SEB53678.1 Predicted flavoprotein CzcO associated with the cation diffusion facilitator CzcD [Microbacterium humi]